MRTLAAVAFIIAAPLSAQSFTNDLHRDANDAQKKIIQLAEAFPENLLDWRPKGDANVRSVREVFLHVASENYYLAGLMGMTIPASSGVTSDYATVTAYEKKPLTKAKILAELNASFPVLHQGLGKTTEANAGEKITWFGQPTPRSMTMIGTVTHLHEHLGQLIAYARSNGIVPPWSR